jgi:trk system potassium uptake protein TrkA
VRALIVGASRLGGVLADELIHAGHEVRVLDPRAEALAALPSAVRAHGHLGSPLREETLSEAAAGCDGVAAVTDEDAVNVVVALASRRRLRVPIAVGVVTLPRLAEALRGLGAHIVCPTTRSARELHLTLVRSAIESELLLGGEVAVCRADVPAHLAGRTLDELARPGEVIPIAVERDGHVLMATAGLALAADDTLHVATSHRERLAELMRP